MAIFTPIEPAQAFALLDYYEIGTGLELIPIASGTENSNYFIYTQQKDHSRNAYVLTIFERLQAAQLPFYLNWMAFLDAASLPVAAPVPLKHAQDAHPDCVYLSSLMCNGITKPYAISKKLAGDWVRKPEKTHIQQVAHNLARMHILGQNYAHKQINLRSLAWWQSIAPQILPHLNADEYHLFTSELAFQEVFFASNAYQAMPKTMCHADLFRDNVLFVEHEQNAKISGFFDFYFAAWDVALFDIAVTINDWCIQDVQENDAGNYAMRQDLLDEFLHAYQAVRPLSAVEKEHLPHMLRAAAMRFWTSRLFDWHAPREAKIFMPHPPAKFEKILQLHRRMF